ncbi:neprilysin-like [Musca domestica]|uniref:Neprilysin-like n=1 Tax=Musca domestica TaxID=7370 RepID=A0A9J7I205_MUSDO|nr:neprilysin-like [Musca domestica]
MKLWQIWLIFAVTLVSHQCLGEHTHETVNLEKQKTIVKSMNLDSEPCSDFLRYSCGNWWRDHNRNQNYYNDHLEYLEYNVTMELIGHLEKPNVMENKPKFAKTVQTLYNSCMNSRTFVAHYYMIVLKQLEGIDWMLLAKNETRQLDYDWLQIFAVASRYGMKDILLDEYIAPMEGEPTQMAIHLRKYANRYGFDRMSDQDFRNLRDTMDTEVDVNGYYKDIENFESKLKELEKFKHPTRSKKIWQVQDIPYEWLKKYLKYLVEPVHSLDPHMRVVVSDLEYLKALDEFLMKSDPKFLRIYMELRFLSYFDNNVLELRKRPCLKSVQWIMPLAMHWIYEDMHPLNVGAHNEIQHMFSRILQEINNTVHQDRYSAIDPESLHKLNTMQLVIGNLPRSNTIEFLEQHYASITVKSQFYKNFLTIQQQNAKRMLEALFNPTPAATEFYDKFENLPYVAVNKPKYYPAHNVMLLPSYLPRTSEYHPEFEDIFKYSFLGSTLASAVYSTLTFRTFDYNQLQMVKTVGGIQASYDVFFAHNSHEHLEVKGDAKDLSLRQLFLINVMQKYCGTFVNEYALNAIVTYLRDFGEVFDCNVD